MPLVPRRRLWGVALAALALGGCNAIFGVGDLGYGEDAANGAGGSGAATTDGTTTNTSSGSATTTSSQSGGGSGSSCTTTQNGCLCFTGTDGCQAPVVPEGWTTNIMVSTTEDGAKPSCEGQTLDGSLDDSDISCPSCACTPAATNCNAVTTWYIDGQCSELGDIAPISANGCTPVPTPNQWEAYDLTFNITGNCTPTGTPAVTPDERIFVCNPDAACEAGCFRAPGAEYDQRICVWREGAHACPDDFANRLEVYDPDDFCTPCTCGNATGGSCTVNLYFNDAVCAGSHAPRSADQTCASNTNEYLSADVEVSQPVSCVAAGGAPIGQEPTVALTVCCNDL